MEFTIDFLKQLAINVYDAVSPLLGTEEAKKGQKKGAGGDISMNIDIVAENVIIETLSNAKANLLLVSEEIGDKYIGDEVKAKQDQAVLIVDPLDGSNNAARGIPYCSVSIAYANGSKISDIQKAVVLNLNTKDIFWAEKEKGAFLNDIQIHVSELD
ncbi:MAG: inositol monophosphatase family protein, partial [Promethearchaeota archaeon]